MNLYFPNISSSALTYLNETLYPPIYNGTQPYTTPFHRLDLAISDFTFTCSTNWLGYAYSNKTHNYVFSVPPGNHTEDVPYTYYNGPISTVKNNTVAIYLEKYLTSFAENADPNTEGLPEWEVYGREINVLNLMKILGVTGHLLGMKSITIKSTRRLCKEYVKHVVSNSRGHNILLSEYSSRTIMKERGKMGLPTRAKWLSSERGD
jgi:hypothetical protein